MKFKNITTGVILETNNEWVIEQMKDAENYKQVEEVKEKVRKPIKED